VALLSDRERPQCRQRVRQLLAAGFEEDHALRDTGQVAVGELFAVLGLGELVVDADVHVEEVGIDLLNGRFGSWCVFNVHTGSYVGD